VVARVVPIEEVLVIAILLSEVVGGSVIAGVDVGTAVVEMVPVELAGATPQCPAV
jgi:hypothetical protein